MTRLLALATVIAILKTPGAVGRDAAPARDAVHGDELERGDGTLPLRLPGDGTLPLKLRGEAVQTESRLTTQITLTSATSAALTGATANALACRLTGVSLSKHAAEGTVLVGLAQYVVKGICYNHDTQEMEVVAARGGERSSMAGGLPAPEPSAFAGRLTITGANPPAGSYNFSLRTVDEHL